MQIISDTDYCGLHNIYLFISQNLDRSVGCEKGWGLQQITLLNIEQ